MKIGYRKAVVDTGGYSTTAAFQRVSEDVEEAIRAVVWPEGSDQFLIRPESGKKRGQGNGVKPIKNGFVKSLSDRGWTEEYGSRSTSKGVFPGAFDCHLDFPEADSPLPFAVEWETGNISSSHRALNRLALGILEERLSGGILILPTKKLSPYLTDRIGNTPELQPYIPLWEKWDVLADQCYIGIIGVEQDGDSEDVERIPKGTDGRAAL